MADPGARPNDAENSGAANGAPRWAKVLGTIAAVFVLLLVIVMLTGGPGAHGPGRHKGSDGGEGQRAPSSAPKDHTPPPGADHSR